MSPAAHYAHSTRRRRVRHKIQTPAYASFVGSSKGAMTDLNEILDISEDGAAIQCAAPLEPNRNFELCLDLAECSGQIHTTAQVVWADRSGRCGFRFSDLPPASLFHLREWLFLNAMAGVANAQGFRDAVSMQPRQTQVRPSYTDNLAAVTAVQREVESAAGSDLSAALQIIADRSQTLTRASGAAIALTATDPNFLICRASSGPDAPPAGARLQLGSGLTGECVRIGKTVRCDDTEIDSRVDLESCRSLGLRSILGAPVRVGDKVIGILEVFSQQPGNFTQNDVAMLQRLADTVLNAVHRTGRNEPVKTPVRSAPRAPAPGSVLFASVEASQENNSQKADLQKPDGQKAVRQKQILAEPETSRTEKIREAVVQLPRSYLIILLCAAATIVLVLVYYLAAGVHEKFEAHAPAAEQTVFASSRPPSVSAQSTNNSSETASPSQLRQLAAHGDAAAENALGLLYAQGDDNQGIAHDEREAAQWFSKAAEHGNVPAQSKLGSLYWSGRGVPQDFNKAYFWTVLARASGDEASKALAPFVAARLTREQAESIETQAEIWFQQHQPQAKP